MSVFDDLENTEDSVDFKGEKIPMFAPDLTESTVELRRISIDRNPPGDDVTDAEKAENNAEYSVALAKKAVELTVPQIKKAKNPDKAAGQLIMKTGGLMGALTIKAITLCGWTAFFVYTVGTEDEQEAKEKEDE